MLNKFWINIVIFIILFLGQSLNLFIFQSKFQELISNFAQIISGIYATWNLYYAYNSLKKLNSTDTEGWKYFFYASILWLIGSIIFAFYEEFLKLPPYPSPADIFYILFYPLIIIGFTRLNVEKVESINKIHFYIDFTILSVLSFLVIWLLSFQDVLNTLLTKPNFATFISGVYSIFDFVLLFVSSAFLIKRQYTKYYTYQILLFTIGCYFLIFSDLSQALITTFTKFTSGSIADIGWTVFSLMLGFSGFITSYNAKKFSKEDDKFKLDTKRSISILGLTYFWFFITIITLVWLLYRGKGFDIIVIIFVLFSIILLIAYRQIMIIKENNELNVSLIKAHNQLENSNDELKSLNQDLAVESQKLVRMNDKLFQSEERLMEANDAKNKFFTIIAHDLRNPVFALSQLTDLLERKYEDLSVEQINEIIKSLSKSTRFTSELLSNLLDWAQTQTGGIEFNPISTNIFEISDKVVKQLHLSLENKNIKLINNWNKIEIVNIDREMIKTIFRNIISNAIKFTPNNGQIELNVINHPKYLILEIKDNGVGMDLETQSKLFDIQYNQKSLGTNKEVGTGLGLIICNEFIKKHDGKITIESELNEGTSFFIHLLKTK